MMNLRTHRSSPAVLLVLLTCLAANLPAQDTTGFAAFGPGIWETAVTGCNFPEGPAWDGKRLYFSNCYGGWIGYREGDTAGVWAAGVDSPFTFKKTNGLGVLNDGSIAGCEYSRGFIFKLSPDKKFSIISSGWGGKAFNRPNDLCVDAYGNILFTDPKSYNKDTANGRVFYITASGTTGLAYDGLCFPNGITISPDGKEVFISESARRRILKFTIEKDLTLHNPEVFAEVPGGDPDGLEFDSDGKLLAAHFGGGAVYVFNPDGSIHATLATPGKKPTNIELAEGWLYLTEAETNTVYRTRYPAGR